MFLHSCLYPFAITLLAILILFVSNSFLSQNINSNLASNSTLRILQQQKKQYVTLLSFVMFLPAFWIYASFLSAKGAGDSGLIWLAATSWDAYAQHKYPSHRRWGYLTAHLVIVGLWIGGVYGLYLGYQAHSQFY
jgi:hypothetical protein